jgi:hypothetical protein
VDSHPEVLGWPARLWLGDRLCLTGHAVDATRGTIRISLVNWIPSDSLEAGVAYRLEVQAGEHAKVWCHAEVEQATSRWVELRIAYSLRTALLPPAPVTELAALASLVSKVRRRMSDITRPTIGERLETLAQAAVRQAGSGNWRTLTATLADLKMLVRFTLKLDELPAEDCQAMRAAIAAARAALLM